MPSALIPLCSLPGPDAIQAVKQIEGFENPVCYGFTPMLLEHRQLCHKIDVGRGVHDIQLILDPVPTSLDPQLRVGKKGETASSHASVYLPTLAWTQAEGPGLYELTALKRMEGTKGYLAQSAEIKGCSDQSYEDCKAEAFLKTVQKKCNCLPWTLAPLQTSAFSQFFPVLPANFCTPAQFRSLYWNI